MSVGVGSVRAIARANAAPVGAQIRFATRSRAKTSSFLFGKRFFGHRSRSADLAHARIYHVFAALDPRGPKRTEQMYLRWVQKLATREYADELVVLCVALELGIRITIIPYTPPSAIGQWAVTTYGREDAEHVLHFGNNDAHYVYLSQAT